MVSYMHVVIFASSAAVACCRGFCDSGEIINLNCPVNSLVTGIQTTSELFSEDATTLCSDMVNDIESDYSTEHYKYKRPDAIEVEIPRPHHSRYFTLPRFFCADIDSGVQNISMCSKDGSITETVVTCRGLKDIVDISMHTVIGKSDSPELKCRGGSVLNRLEYDWNEEGKLIAIAKCIQAEVPSSVQNCSVVEKTRVSIRVSCDKSSDEGVKPSFLVETYNPRSHHPTSLSFQSPDFLVKGLAPATEYHLNVYAVNFRGRSPPLTMKASTLGWPKSETGAEGCEDGTLVEIECPDGYIVTGVNTNSKYFVSPDMHPLCSKISDKLILNLTDPSIPTSTSKIYPRKRKNKFLQVECSEAAPVVLRQKTYQDGMYLSISPLREFSMCFVNNKIWRSVTHCRSFQDNATVSAYYVIEGRLGISSVLKCPEGSFLNSIKMEWDGHAVTIPVKCIVIKE